VRAATQRLGALAVALCAASACSGPQQSTPSTRPQPAQQGERPERAGGPAQPPAWIVKMDRDQPHFSAADVEFMQGMIHHHAQAILMAGWAPTHDASPAIRELCARIVVAQRDEIAFMQRWLRERNQEVPDADVSHFMMPGMTAMLMPGMLTAKQLALLNDSRGKDFDQRFLAFMIMHHQGAIAMVEKLFESQGATQDDLVFKFASDVNADQSAEIERMNRLLTTGTLAPPPTSR
jgi:uncharacterized protein (DUF305 family)